MVATMTAIRWEDEYEHHIDASLDLPQKEKDKLKAMIKALILASENAEAECEQAKEALLVEQDFVAELEDKLERTIDSIDTFATHLGYLPVALWHGYLNCGWGEINPSPFFRRKIDTPRKEIRGKMIWRRSK